MRGQRPRSALHGRLARGLVVLTAVSASLVLTSAPISSADTKPTVTGVDTLGFPYVDLVLAGVTAPAANGAPVVSVMQSGTAVPATATWLLSPGQPLAVVTDADQASLAQVQGIVGELVQSLPPAVPLGLVSSTSDRVSTVSVNRDAFMAALRRQQASAARPVSAGISAAASAGIQHVFVVTTCASPPPEAPPTGVIADVLGVGPGCSAGWRSALSGRTGRFVAAASTAAALSALDELVSEWRSSVVVVAQASSRDPLQVSAGAGRASVQLGAAPRAAGAPPTKAAVSSAASDGGSSTGLVLWVGLVLLVLAGALVAFLAVRRRAARRADLLEPVPGYVTVGARLPTLPSALPSARPAPGATASPLPRPMPAVIDLRDPAGDPSGMPLMAVATPGPVRQAEHPLPATVALRDVTEEPPAMAENHDADEPTAQTSDVAAQEQTDVEAAADQPGYVVVGEPAEGDAEMPAAEAEAPAAEAEAPAAEAADEAADEAAEVEAPAAEVEAPAAEVEAPAAEAAAPVAEAVADAPAATNQLAPIEFNWTPLTFSELTWRSDQDRMQPATIDLRDSATVDVREKTARRQKTRRKAGR